MQSAELFPHPATPCPLIRHLTVRLRLTTEGSLCLEYAIDGDVNALRIPGVLPPRRVDGLWQHTCCEVFLKEDGLPGYCEFNFAPSTEWAAYRFDGYREGMSALEIARLPEIAMYRDVGRLELKATLELEERTRGRGFSLALAAVIEATDGGLSYWALRHPEGRPDFHHPDGFALKLAPAIEP